MADEVERLVVAAFKEIVDKANVAVENAKEADEDVAPSMLKAAQALAKEGERALKRIEPICQKNYKDYGASFVDAVKENDEIAQFRSDLDDLLWDFDEYVEADAFDAEKFEELQRSSRKAAPKIVDILKRMKLVASAATNASIVVEPPKTEGPYEALQENGDSLLMRAQAGPDLGVNGTPEVGAASRATSRAASSRAASRATASDLDRNSSHQSEISDELLDPPPRPPPADPWEVGNPPPTIPLPPSPFAQAEEARPTERRSPVSPGDSPTLPSAYPVGNKSFHSSQQQMRPSLDSWKLKEDSRRKHSTTSSHSGTPQNDPLLSYWQNKSYTSNVRPNDRLRADSFTQPPTADKTRPSSVGFGGSEPPRYYGQSDAASNYSSRQSRPPSGASPVFGNPSPSIPENFAVNSHTHQDGYLSKSNFPPRQASLSHTHPQPTRQRSTDSFNSSIFECVPHDAGAASPVASTSTQRTSSVLSTTPGSPYSPSAQLPQYSAHPPNYKIGAMAADATSPTAMANSSSTTLTAQTNITTPHPTPRHQVGMEVSMASPVRRFEAPMTSPGQRFDDPGLIPVESEAPEHHPIPMREPDTSLGPNSSFYQMKGFCRGAEEALRGELGFKKIRRPTGAYAMAVVAKCNHCMFELDFKTVEQDMNNDSTGNYSSNTIGFRLRIMQKSHMKIHQVEEQLYGCVFCVHQGHTIDESDATVFFSRKQLFLHLARHPRPLPFIPGLTVVETVDLPPHVKDNFDLHFPNPPIQSVMQGISPEINRLPTGIAMETAKNSHGIIRCPPDRAGVLQFAQGARIVGIEFPARYEGKWGIGWHDGVRATFDADQVNLTPPPRNEVRMQGMSSMQAVARWKWNQKGEGNWLKFDKGEVIKNISWTYTDHWCWSGTSTKSSKGWGIFPQTHIDPNSIRAMQAGDAVSVSSAEKKNPLSRFSIRRNTDRNKYGSFPSV